jgi:phenylpropionate dioxygenase-like ring-hydroxylating dioxygenase large terminal subunit
MYVGWYQVAFEREVSGDIHVTAIGELPLIIVRAGNDYRTFDAICPHRGAHLGFGGELREQVIVCPFHGHEIGLGHPSPEGYCIREYATLTAGGLIFVLISQKYENGFSNVMKSLDQSHYFVPGFVLQTRVSPDIVMENAVDKRHFKYVHGVNNEPELKLQPSQQGELAIEGIFQTNHPNPWQSNAPESRNSINTRFFARVYSPAVCLTELGDGQNPYLVISAATPQPDGKCTIRVSVALAPDADGKPPSDDLIRALLRDSKISFEQDLKIWENMSTKSTLRFAKDDGLMIEYHKFCRRFVEEA